MSEQWQSEKKVHKEKRSEQVESAIQECEAVEREGSPRGPQN